MAETFPFRLIAPTGIAYEGPVEQVIAVGALGEFGVLANHINYITSILPCVVTLELGDGSVTEYLVSGGLAEVTRSDDWASFLKRAESAMQASVQAGRDNTHFHNGQSIEPVIAIAASTASSG